MKNVVLWLVNAYCVPPIVTTNKDSTEQYSTKKIMYLYCKHEESAQGRAALLKAKSHA